MSPPARVTFHAAESNCQRSFLGRTNTRPHPDTGLLAHLRLDLLTSHLARRLGRLGGHTLRGAAILVVTASTTWLARALVFPVLLFPPLQVGASFTLADVAFLLAALGDGLRSAGRWKHGVARFDFVITCVFHGADYWQLVQPSSLMSQVRSGSGSLRSASSQFTTCSVDSLDELVVWVSIGLLLKFVRAYLSISLGLPRISPVQSGAT